MEDGKVVTVVGGLGEGYNQARTNGTAGLKNQAYGLSRGGNGGNGGVFGAAGQNGATGGQARFKAPSSSAGLGGFGGAAGSAIKNDGATWTNGTTTGTYQGSY